MSDLGHVVRVAGPVVVVEGLTSRLYNVVRVGRRHLVGEVIRLSGPLTVVQVYESTSGLKVGSPVVDTGAPLQVELGPGLLGGVFDGIQRSLPTLAMEEGRPHARPFIRRGIEAPALDRTRMWNFEPAVAVGDQVATGDVLATVAETDSLQHRILVPPGRSGTVTACEVGAARVEDPVVWIDGEPLAMLSRWPVRRKRPVAMRIDPTRPLITGQRVIDTLFPLARGGSATIPGGFGTGKTVQEQTLARWVDADVIIYVGCGERGNELAEVLEQFPQLVDPRSGGSLMDRTILIANTSNMPVAAREASIYTGITIAEYYRDQGYDVAILADSTSRWGEALREVSSRLEEMPGEEGFPAYLPSRLAEFYERSGAVECLGRDGRTGSVTVVGAVSPPGGDFSEPVTQYSLRLAGTFWALDTDLARRRHYPAIHWSRSYSLYQLGAWFNDRVAPDWEAQRQWAIRLLDEEEELRSVVQLLGIDVLDPSEQVLFRTGRLLREDFLQQSAFDEIDAHCAPDKQYWMLRVIRETQQAMAGAVGRGVAPDEATTIDRLGDVATMRWWPAHEAKERATALIAEVQEEVDRL